MTRARLLAAKGTDTVNTRVFDVALGYSWPPSLPERVLRNDFSDRWDGHEDSLDAKAAAELAEAVAVEDFTRTPINAGQGVGALNAVRPAADVINQMSSRAAELLSRWHAG